MLANIHVLELFLLRSLAYNDGKGCSEVVQETPFSAQFLRISQLCQTAFILNLEVDVGVGRHDRIRWGYLSGGIGDVR